MDTSPRHKNDPLTDKVFKSRNKISNDSKFNSNTNQTSVTNSVGKGVMKVVKNLDVENINYINKKNDVKDKKDKKKNNLNFDSLIIDKIKTSLKKFYNQSVISASKQINENKMNNNNNFINIQKADVFITGSTIFENFKDKYNTSRRNSVDKSPKIKSKNQTSIKQINPKISTFQIFDYNTGSLNHTNIKPMSENNYYKIETLPIPLIVVPRYKSQSEFQPLPTIPYKFKSGNESKLKKIKKPDESADNVVNFMMFNKPGDENDPTNKFTVKSIKRFREKTKMEGYKKLMSVNNSMLKMQMIKVNGGSIRIDSKENLSNSSNYSHRKIMSFIN
jgi:hypothetical protein